MGQVFVYSYRDEGMGKGNIWESGRLGGQECVILPGFFFFFFSLMAVEVEQNKEGMPKLDEYQERCW